MANTNTAGQSARIDEDGCTGCGMCRDVCSAEAIERMGPDGCRVLGERCEACGTCTRFCPAGCIELPNVP